MDTVLSWLATVGVLIFAAIAAFGPAYAVCMRRAQVNYERVPTVGHVVFALIPLVFISAAVDSGDVAPWIPVTFAVLGIVSGVVAGWDGARLERRGSVAE